MVTHTNVNCYWGTLLLFPAYIFVIIRYAPIQSKQRVLLTAEMKKRYKWYSFFLLGFWIIVMVALKGNNIGLCIFWTLSLQLLEILRMKGGKLICSIKNC